jgi:hypothetical protein
MRKSRNILLLALAMASPAWSQDPSQLATGSVYTEQTVSVLIDRPVSSSAYLVGRFFYLPESTERADFKIFCNADISSITGFVPKDIILGVRFFYGAPSLSVGKAIIPDERNPLIIRSVKRSNDGKKIIILAESRIR